MWAVGSAEFDVSESAGKTYPTPPYRVEYRDSSERGRSRKTLEDAISEALWHLHRVWRETGDHGVAGEYITIPNAPSSPNGTPAIAGSCAEETDESFQTPAMFEDEVADQGIDST